MAVDWFYLMHSRWKNYDVIVFLFLITENIWRNEKEYSMRFDLKVFICNAGFCCEAFNLFV